MEILKRETENLVRLQNEFIGINPHPDIYHIPVGYIGDYEVEVDYQVDIKTDNTDTDYSYEVLSYKKIVIADNNPKHLSERHQWLIDNAYGDVIVFGLGLGDSLNILLKKQSAGTVKDITVVEKEQEIIDLVSPVFATEKVNFIQGDIFSFIPTKKCDTIYLAIWNNVNQNTANTLQQKFTLYCEKCGYIYQ